jgi:hypothetical protein
MISGEQMEIQCGAAKAILSQLLEEHGDIPVIVHEESPFQRPKPHPMSLGGWLDDLQRARPDRTDSSPYLVTTDGQNNPVISIEMVSLKGKPAVAIIFDSMIEYD